jgi:hypothetical protein
MQKMILYFCHISSNSRNRSIIEKFKSGEEPDYFEWLSQHQNSINGTITNHSITYYEQKVTDELPSN